MTSGVVLPQLLPKLLMTDRLILFISAFANKVFKTLISGVKIQNLFSNKNYQKVIDINLFEFVEIITIISIK